MCSFGTQSQTINSILSQMFSNINCPIKKLWLKQMGGREKKMKMKKLNVSDFHDRLLLFHGKGRASNWNIFNCADLTGTEML